MNKKLFIKKNKARTKKKAPEKKKILVKKKKLPKKTKLTIMVSSTVFNSVEDLDQIKYILEGYGYNVIMSKEGNVYVPIGYNPEQACLKAVEDCDLFFGIIFPRYGSGITHKEFLKAVELDKPRWFVSHEKIEYLRKLFEQFIYDKNKKRNGFDIKKTSVLDSIKVIDMYNDVRDKWIQTFSKTSELQVFLETQFGNMKLRIEELEKQNKK